MHKSQYVYLFSVVCLLYFEPFRVYVIFLSVFDKHIYKEYARVRSFTALLVVLLVVFEAFQSFCNFACET